MIDHLKIIFTHFEALRQTNVHAKKWKTLTVFAQLQLLNVTSTPKYYADVMNKLFKKPKDKNKGNTKKRFSFKFNLKK